MGTLSTYFTLLSLLSTAYRAWGVAGRKRRLSAARQNTWAGGMLCRDSVSLTPLTREFEMSTDQIKAHLDLYIASGRQAASFESPTTHLCDVTARQYRAHKQGLQISVGDCEIKDYLGKVTSCP